MNTQELLAQTKLRLDDEIAPRTYSDSDVLLALNDAQNEFALRTLCIFDGEAEVLVQAQSPWVTLPAGTVWLTAGLLNNDSSLRLVTQHELELGYFDLEGVETTTRYSNWRAVNGTPAFLVTDLGPRIARLVPRPTQAGVLTLERYRLPVQMSTDAAAPVDPEIPVAQHPDLVIGALAYLFDIPDQEVYDKEMAMLKRNAWEQRLQLAQQLLRTATRALTHFVPPPPGTTFLYAGANTIGVDQNVNT